MSVRMFPLMVLVMSLSTAQGVELPPCPASPNCVSSQSTDTHRIEPFLVQGDPDAAFKALQRVLSQRSDARLTVINNDVMQVEFRTVLGFVDDGLFVLDRIKQVIQVRSAARLGYWDLGKNRRRIEEIRQKYSNVMRKP